MAQYERETVQFHPVAVTRNDETVTTGVEFAVTAPGNRPETWAPAEVVAGQTGLMVENMAPGPYTVWARVTSGVERVVIDTGTIEVR